ncbi:MAG: U32 family peptidase C-terminal domain-containing protein, partial [Clostridia bacterium]|nr:U32 family peptidase C-terminal domain-containing protein [Clostridia bacterium]
YTTGFYFDENQSRQYYPSSKAVEEYKFIAVVKQVLDGAIVVEQRNKFVVGEELEILSVTERHNKIFAVQSATDQQGNSVEVCNKVKQLLTIPCDFKLAVGDMLRKKN